MDNAENEDMRKGLPDADPVLTTSPAIPRQQTPPPQYSQTNPDDVMTPTMSLPPNYGYPAMGAAPPQPPTASGTYHNSGGQIGVGNSYLPNPGQKTIVETYMLAVSPLGLLGAHHFYLQRFYWGIIYFFTFGLLGCGYLIDWFRVPCLVKEANEKLMNPGKRQQKTKSDAYTLWFPMGLLGFHHYYLGNYAWGVVYTCTLGLCGVGWIVDGFRMCALVRAANEIRDVDRKSGCLTVSLALSPFGVLGAHHYYLNRPVWGLLYTFTLGLGGLGWILDWFRLSVLLKRVNKEISGERSPDVKTLDDTYILWFPFGLLGFHHFYLGRPIWGLLYFFTLGLGGIGWLIDAITIPSLVKKANIKIGAEQERRALSLSFAGQPQGPPGFSTTGGVLPTQGYTNYGMVNQAAYAAPSWLYPPQGTTGYNYQQTGPVAAQTPEKPPMENFVPTASPYGHPGYNESGVGPQYLGTVNDPAPPPPYQPSAPRHDHDVPDKRTHYTGGGQQP